KNRPPPPATEAPIPVTAIVQAIKPEALSVGSAESFFATTVAEPPKASPMVQEAQPAPEAPIPVTAIVAAISPEMLKLAEDAVPAKPTAAMTAPTMMTPAPMLAPIELPTPAPAEA